VRAPRTRREVSHDNLCREVVEGLILVGGRHNIREQRCARACGSSSRVLHSGAWAIPAARRK
jgi:hypothetical protein